MHNPGGVGGYAAVGLDDEKILFEVYGSDFVTSNNRMELRAAIEACKQEVHRRMTIYSDSQYVVNGASRGLPKWVISGTLQKQTNADLWEELYQVMRRRIPVTFQWVRGHDDNVWNDRADELAGVAMRKTLESGSLISVARILG